MAAFSLCLAAQATALAPAGAAGPLVKADISTVADSATADTEANASVIAVKFQHDVTVTSETSPTLLTTALAVGGFKQEADQVPSRVLQNGAWTPEDTTLGPAVDGWFSPRAAAASVRFSAGGTTQMAQVQVPSGDWVTESWPYGALPTPQISGSSVTYPNVFPDVDLELTATAPGMSEVLVVKTPAGAADPQLANVQFGIAGATLTVANSTTKALLATTPGGAKAVSAAPLWWDSAGAKAGPLGAGGGDARAMAYSNTATSVGLNVDSVTATPNLQYPVYIDPDWSSNSAYLQADWYDDRAYPNQSYLDPSSDSVGYGISGGIGYLSRAFFQFQTSQLAGKYISSSQFRANQTYSNSCDTTTTQLWNYGPSTSPGFTWNQEPAAWNTLLDQNVEQNGGPCAPAANWVGLNATSAVTAAAASGQGSIQLGLRSANEGNSLTRKHYDWNAQLITTYDTPPNAASNLMFGSAIGSKGCGTQSNPTPLNPTVAGVNLPMQAVISDADSGQTVQGVFYIDDMTVSPIAQTAAYISSYLRQGSTFVWNYTAPTTGSSAWVNGHTYKWYVVSRDDTGMVGPHSIDCFFKVYTTGPSAANISVTPTGGQTLGDVATAGITDPTDQASIQGYEYWVTPGGTVSAGDPPVAETVNAPSPCTTGLTVTPGGNLVGFACPGTNGQATISIGMPDLTSVLNVVAYDAAGNVSPRISGSDRGAYAAFSLKPAANLSFETGGHQWATDLVSGSPIPDSNTTSNATNLNLAGDVSVASGNSPLYPTGTSLTFTGTNGQTPTEASPVTGGSLLNSSASFSASVWMEPTTAGESATALSLVGPQGYGFSLELSQGHPVFCMRSQVAATPAHGACLTDTVDTPAVNTWTWVTGVYDAKNHLMRILLNGSTQSTAVMIWADDTTDPGASGPLAVGSDVTSTGVTTQEWVGQLGSPAVVPGVIDGSQLGQLMSDSDPS